jgi:hypothetical protein
LLVVVVLKEKQVVVLVDIEPQQEHQAVAGLLKVLLHYLLVLHIQLL